MNYAIFAIYIWQYDLICVDLHHELTKVIENMSANIVETIQSRLDLMGMSQAQFAEAVSATPSQVGIFFKGKGSLSTERLNKAFDVVGIDLSLYTKRTELAKEVASFLLSRHVDSIENWPKNDLAFFTKKKEISLLFDVESKEKLEEMVESGIVDIESTYPFFKALTQYYMGLGRSNPTASQAKHSIEAITKTILASAAMGAALLSSVSPIIEDIRVKVAGNTAAEVGTAVGKALGTASVLTKQAGAVSLFTKVIGASLFTKALSYFNKE